ncbi:MULTISPECIES: glutamate ABC transporter substrate-binding protein [unclassified Mycolicibacterium]|uniref:glutamate ABC transporter substrate-binding protein n=1 Tax=unclassified Mycolicibacterium TaxID=2636767 RepID=UPI0012DBF42B|nr:MULTISPECIES: glutamate ABC transporter substrate-binding protein [unclassified Mycolicibacterium]MUL85385.1 glutamate ABC transporter substrate-binding protein [Mycolicibacterium sp. CBMA 329]MUL88851.1 glutamate ABC transporter substrate-binding protein [Mycolicibacterium sp. CBMA 331]MUM01875.1 glutamate ABC transporter substrate-binding protein [Mycolicibacterium sp. CBMA 334]MUM27602.1 glutamate ABC transporter substrate-binding protein [Mycolicibacterium sp. CBMA 295]MUM40498.1 glutam
MRAVIGLLVLAAAALTGCSTVQPLVEVPASLTTLPLPSGAAVVSRVPGAAVESCDATASLRPPAGSGPNVQAIRQRGRLIVGIDQSTNLFSFRDPVSGELQGFDVDIAREVARDLLGDPDRVEFRLLTAPERFSALEDGTVDIVLKAMTITCARAERIAFSTVYFDASQRLLVPKDSPIRGPGDLAGKRVCSQVDTTSLATVARVAPAAILLAVQNWDDCLVAMQQGQADAVSTDNTILAGMAVQDPNLQLVGPSLEAEPYGIGVNKSRDDLVRAVNASLERIRRDGTWLSLYRKWLTVLGPPPSPPEPKYRD